MKFTREIKTAVLVIGCIIVFIAGFTFLDGKSLLNNEITVSTYFEEVEGLTVGAKVTISGHTIGKVNQIDLAKDRSGVKVLLGIQGHMTFSNKSIAQLYEVGIISGKAIAILPDYEMGEGIQNGDVLLSETKPGLTELLNSQIVPLQAKLESMITSADSLLAGVNNVLNYDSQSNLQNTLTGLSQSVENIAVISKSLRNTLENKSDAIDETLENLKHTAANFSMISDSLTQIEIGATINEFKAVGVKMNTLLTKLDADENSVGKLLSDKEFYDNLTESVNALESLLIDLKENPKRYVHFSLFGRKDKPKENTENP